MDADGANFDTKEEECLILLTKSLHVKDLDSIDGLGTAPLELIYGIHKGYARECYLTLLMVGALISVRIFLSLARIYPGLPPVVSLN